MHQPDCHRLPLFGAQVPEGCAENPDGTKYGDHCLATKDWDVVREMTGVLWHVAQLVNILQGENYVTVSLVFPMLGQLVCQLADDRPVTLQDERGDKELYVVDAQIMDSAVRTARRELRSEIIRRFYTTMQASDAEDIGIATLLDPRYVAHPLYYIMPDLRELPM